jgi:hypothetical protein
MRIKEIVIELELEKDDRPDHATTITMENGAWTMNGPCYPRFLTALSDFYHALKGQKR